MTDPETTTLPKKSLMEQIDELLASIPEEKFEKMPANLSDTVDDIYD